MSPSSQTCYWFNGWPDEGLPVGRQQTMREAELMIINAMAATLFLVGAYYVWDAIQSGELVWLVMPAILFIVGLGLAIRARWGAVSWYVFAIAGSLWWLATVVALAVFAWPEASAAQSLIALIPGLSLLGFCVLGSVVVHRQFRKRGSDAV